jgi:hypothetical protein
MKVALLVGVLAQAYAAVPPASRTAPTAEADTRDNSSLQSHLALAVAERLLASADSDDRVRGVDRLASAGQREAIDRLVRALEPSAPTWRDVRARIAALRALSPFASRESVRQALTKALSIEPGRTALAVFAQETAAMALAASEDPRATEALVAAVREGGSASGAAEHALLAYPPKSLVAFGTARDGLAPAVSRLLARLGDVRGVGLLRATLSHGVAARTSTDGGADAPGEDQNKRARIAAALALAELGDEEQIPVARSWLVNADLELKLAGAEVLARSGAKEADDAVTTVLRVPELRAPAVRLAATMPRAAMLGALADAVTGNDATAKIALAAMGRIGSREAINKLSAFAREPSRALDAAFALARAPGADARSALEGLLREPAQKRLAARAGVVRALVLDDAPSGLSDVLDALLASPDAADRAAAAFGKVALRDEHSAKWVRSDDAVVARAAARAALVAGHNTAVACVARLATEKDAVTRSALGLALVAAPDRWGQLSTDQLSEWADSDQPIAPLAAVVLGERERDGVESAAQRLLASPDPVVRAHAALGLARSPLADATGRLADALRFEPDDAVRRAIVTALATRKESQRVAALESTLRFDPEPRVRELARLAVRGALPSMFGVRCYGSGVCHVAWISLTPSMPSVTALVANRAATLLDASGLSLPVVADPDGAVIVPGISAGSASFRLASSAL